MESTSIPYYNYIFYGLFFLISVFFSLLINFLILRFSRTLGIRNVSSTTGMVRWGSTTKPALGGFSFYIIFLVSIAILGVIPTETSGYMGQQMIGLLAASSLGFLIGLADDAYNTNPLVKFIGQLTCALLLVTTNFEIAVTSSPEFNYALTIIWVIGLMNSINMLDNMDGITSSVSISVLIGGIVIVVLDGQLENQYLIMMMGVLGALIGFLYFNWNPSRMYMGDTGSQFLGVFLAGISILFFWNHRSNNIEFFELRAFVIPMLLFIVPLIDTATVVIRRLMRRSSPFVGGRDHITHHLAYLGLSDRWVATVLLSVSLISVGLVAWVYTLFEAEQWTFGYTLAAFGYFFVLFGVMQVLYNLGKKKHALKQASEKQEKTKDDKSATSA